MDNRDQRIKLIRSINSILRDYQGKILSPEDFNILWELDVDQLISTRHELLRQYKQADTVKQ